MLLASSRAAFTGPALESGFPKRGWFRRVGVVSLPPWNPVTHPWGPGGPHAGEVVAWLNPIPWTPPRPKEVVDPREIERLSVERAAALAEWEANALSALAAIGDPTERMVRALVEIRQAVTPELDAMLPKEWDDRQIAQWFLRVVRTPPGELEYHDRGFFGSKRRTTPAWAFPDGSTELFQWGDTCRYRPISICKDGRIRYAYSWEPSPDARFAPKMLRQMMEMANLPPLDLPPRPVPLTEPRPDPDTLPYPGFTDFRALDAHHYVSFVLHERREDHEWW